MQETFSFSDYIFQQMFSLYSFMHENKSNISLYRRLENVKLNISKINK